MFVRLSAVGKSFGDREILQSASHEFRGPGSTAIMGPSGAGKSTLLSLIAGLDVPDSGSIEHSTEDDVAWIVQSSPLLTRRTVWENVALGAECRGVEVHRESSTVRDVLERLAIGPLADEPVGRLSGGERQRVAVARGIVSGAEILLADEPTASLDARSRSLVCDALQAVVDAGRLILVATHDEYVARRCDEILSVEGGRIRVRA